mmetsp:Transcript_16403/g.29048  ORF Transcript_16403/g.29048 Transcript_16403/m.29048 type:complete len:140 (+) Transcript_16403:53-472(+)|eukprot:CAMPEP_0184523876 /NCGR_PEP_ID=MMETSP0198_2-20121128/9157_1 /TAXON_ID=1112570 /ORGANISM="Thraustochytrium sp., Strain LLF1b" /LENGTH=139 /DNA_ID=CAMNT_0026915015 /DNA_START=59 /DNA_END=478 /DNA_ORIENTATION=+
MPGGKVSYQGSALKANPKVYNKGTEVRKGGHGHEPVRLFVKAVFFAYKGGMKNQHQGTSLLKLKDVHTKEDARFYLGKRLVYIYKASKANKAGSKYRTIWGKVTRTHGNNGAVRAKFKKNLPAQAMGQTIRCMLYPSQV